MKIIDKYILKEIAPIFILANVFLVFMLMLEKIVMLAELFFTKGVHLYLVVQTIVLYIPAFLMITVPVSTLIATMIGFSRLSGDSELIAMKTTGLSGYNLVKIASIVGGIAMGIALLMSIKLMPYGSAKAVDNILEMAQVVSIKDMKENEIYDQIPGLVFYTVNKNKGDEYDKLIVIDRTANTVITSKKAKVRPTQNKELFFEMDDGRIVSTSPYSKHSIINFKKTYMNIPVEVKEKRKSKPVRFMNLEQLMENFKIDAQYRFEYSKRFAMPFACLLMALLGMSLGIFSKRAGRTLGLPISVVVIALYNMLVFSFENMSISGQIEPFTAAWLPNLIIAAMAALSMFKVFR